MVEDHSCIRVFKESQALRARGHVVEMLSRQEAFGANTYQTYGRYFDAAQLQRSVSASRADVFHVHNEPDWLVGVVRLGTEKPIVFDVHDLESLRWGRPPEFLELEAFSDADGFVHVSPECEAAAARYHGRAKPSAVLPCFINEQFYPEHDLDAPSWNTVVYEGGLPPRKPELPDALKALAVAEVDHEVNFRGIEPVVEAFARAGFEFRVHPASPLEDRRFEDLGAVVFEPLQFPMLIRTLRSYGYGLVGGGPAGVPLMDAALPNKLFEYLSQGVVPVVINAAAAARFVTDHGVGIVLKGLDNLREQLEPGPRIRERILERRRDWTMEKNIGVVEDLYQAVLDRRKAGLAFEDFGPGVPAQLHGLEAVVGRA